MARRGIFAQLIHESRVAAREHERAQRAATREHNAAVRRAEQAHKAAEQAQARFARAASAERKRLEKEAREAHIADMEASAEEQNLGLAEVYSDIDSLLAATLEVDDHVDLETYRVTPQHPEFDRRDLETPIPAPVLFEPPPKPALVVPVPPKGLSRLIGGRKHAALLAKAKEEHEGALVLWRKEVEAIPTRREMARNEHARAEGERVLQLNAARARYTHECAARDAEAAEQNKQLDTFIANLSYGTAEAVQEYISIVLANSVYPSHFRVEHEFQFEPTSAELRLRVEVPGPDDVPSIKAYKYQKSSDEVVSTVLSQKACRDRYASAVHQVALRSIHEVFEADRRGTIKTVSLEVGASAVDPATGQQGYVPFVVVAAERETFRKFDLAEVTPHLTLEHLSAAVSKNPFGLVPAETTGVRRL